MRAGIERRDAIYSCSFSEPHADGRIAATRSQPDQSHRYRPSLMPATVLTLGENHFVMNTTTRRPPKAPTVLFIHDGSDYAAHLKHLVDAGLRVTDAHRDAALPEALKLQPDIIVLDVGLWAATSALLKAHSLTVHIPVIVVAVLAGST